MGIVTASEQRPKLVKSFMTAAFLCRLWSARMSAVPFIGRIF
jgi:hypothetical protein